MKKSFLSLILVLVLVLASTLLSSCEGSDASYDKGYDDYEYSTDSTVNGSYGTGFDGRYDYPAEAPEAEAPMDYEKPVTEDSKSDVTAGRKIIYTSSFNLETKEYDKSIATLDALCAELNAWYESSNSYGTAENGDRNAYFTVRVPVENYRAFVSRQGSIGVIVSSSENNRDVTEQYVDAEARLASATLREERVLQILANADQLDEVLTLERELSDIRYEIESITGTLRKYDSQVSYSTVTVSIREVTVITPTPKKTLTFSERLSKAFNSGIDNFVANVQELVITISYNFIAFAIWLLFIIAGLIVLFVYLHKRKKARKQAYDTALNKITHEKEALNFDEDKDSESTEK